MRLRRGDWNHDEKKGGSGKREARREMDDDLESGRQKREKKAEGQQLT